MLGPADYETRLGPLGPGTTPHAPRPKCPANGGKLTFGLLSARLLSMSTKVLPDRLATRRSLVLRQLTALFLAEGFLSFGVGDLAARLRCSRSTLYLVAESKEDLIATVIRNFFKSAAVNIEAKVTAESDIGRRITVYLAAVATELRPASKQFYNDLAAYPLANRIYEHNTRQAGRRIQELVSAGVESGDLRHMNPLFVGVAVSQVMLAIQNGVVGEVTGLGDSTCYEMLADLVVRALTFQADNHA
jgi:AcrR family transcriptional regulator